MALRWSGLAPHDAATATQAWYAHRGIPVPLSYFDARTNIDWLLVKPRVVYPALSVPRVWLFGIRGMLVVPSLAFQLTSQAVFFAAKARSGAAPARVAVLLVLLSSFLSRWGTSSITDPVLTGWIALLMLLLPRRSATVSRSRTVVIVAVILLMCFTRQSAPMPAAILAFGWLWLVDETRQWRNSWTAIAVGRVGAAIAATVVISRWAPYPLVTAMMRETHYTSLSEAWSITR